MKNSTRLLVLTAGVLATFAGIGGAVATPLGEKSIAAKVDDSAPSVTVRYDVLSLSTDAGLKRLYARLNAAAREVCPEIHSRDARIASEGRECQARAVAEAVRQINNPKLALMLPARAAHRG